jgi:hypothetical protein
MTCRSVALWPCRRLPLSTCRRIPVTRRRPAIALVLLLSLAAVLAGCRAGGPGEPVPAGPISTQAAPSPTLSPATTLTWTRPRMVRVVDGYSIVKVNAQQYELIGRRLYQVLRREGLWDQGVRFGANADSAKDDYFVLIKPGLSQLSARQILNRLLGVY